MALRKNNNIATWLVTSLVSVALSVGAVSAATGAAPASGGAPSATVSASAAVPTAPKQGTSPATTTAGEGVPLPATPLPNQTNDTATTTQSVATAPVGGAKNTPVLSTIETAMIATGKESTKSTPQNFELGALRQFGYNFFRAGADPFGAMGDIPVGPDYLLGTGDRINVTVWGSIDASYPLEVNRSGEIVVPKVGTIKVAGVAFGQLHQLLNGQFSRIFRNFQLNVTMGKLRMVKVYVVGEVATPGDYTITSLSTLLNALAAAGGPTHNGSLRAIAIKRDGKLVDTIDLYDFFLRGDKSRDIKLQPGDTVFVPTIGPVVGIAGNVRRPAIFELKGEKNLKDLLVLADGIVPTGYLQRLQIMGVEANEKKSVTDVSLDPKTSGKDLDSLAGGISIKDMDLVKIFPIDNTLRGYAHLEGYVLRPGDYAVRPAMRVEQLLSPDNLLPEYFRELGQITRLMPPDYHAELLFFNVAQARI